MKRLLHILVAESPANSSLRSLILPRRRIRLAGSEQECLDLAYAGSADIMVIDLDGQSFADAEFVRRVRFASRNAFPIVGVACRERAAAAGWPRSGLAEILVREDLTAERLDSVLRHWVRYRRMQRRLFEADRRALEWWKNLVDALDEVRRRMERGSDSLGAFLELIEGQEGENAELRRRHVISARQQIAELNQISSDLDVAARTIQLRGLERSERDARCRRPAIRSAAGVSLEDAEEAGSRFVEGPPHIRGSQGEERRFGT